MCLSHLLLDPIVGRRLVLSYYLFAQLLSELFLLQRALILRLVDFELFLELLFRSQLLGDPLLGLLDLSGYFLLLGQTTDREMSTTT